MSEYSLKVMFRYTFIIILTYLYFCVDPLMKKKPDNADLMKIFRNNEHHYKLVGTCLDVGVADLLPLPQMTTDNLITVFQRWKDRNEDVTWEKIAKVCEDHKDELGQVQSNLLEYLSLQEAHEKYLEKPDNN